MNDTIHIIKNHTSIRKFNHKPISEMAVNTIIDSAKRGATAGNMMLYSIIKIRSKERLQALSELCDQQAFIADADFGLLFVVDCSKWHHYFLLRDMDKKFGYRKPTMADFILGMQDSMIAAQNAVIAAESMGIGTCYIGDIMENNEQITELFLLPEYSMPATLITFGHFDVKPKLRSRFDDRFTVYEEQYQQTSDDDLLEMFKEAETKNPDFAEMFYKRKMDAPFFTEMNRSINNYLSQWQK